MIFYLLFAAAAASQPPAANPQAAENPPKKEKRICKTDNFVGSHIPRRICKTEAEWEAGKQGAKDTLDKLGRGGDYRNPTGPNR
jgi:predicted secreted protein